MAQWIKITDGIIFLYMAFTVLYISFFAFLSLWGSRKKYPESQKRYRFLVLIPAYREDKVIMDSVNSVLAQDYPKEKLDLVVISDKMEESTNHELSLLPITLLQPDFKESSKAVALNFAMNNLPKEKYDIVVILDADNVVENNFICELNDAYHSGSQAMQAHRVSKNLNTDMAILDAVSEEINNSVFRKGHVNLGISSALIGSGMAFDFKWFKENVTKLETAGEDKELEILLIREGVYIDYLDNVKVYDEKTQKESVFYNQRRRWLSAQFTSLFMGLKNLPGALFSFNLDYIDKIIQWMLLPRVLTLGIITIASVGLLFLNWIMAIKWWFILMLLIFAFAMAIPDYLVNKRTIKTLKRIPFLFILMFFNLFRLKGASKKFIHTHKG
jgi:cellulose synthase/poly-beta-1,6-N-acetylglucosamine synthase-like glycosyltransferase